MTVTLRPTTDLVAESWIQLLFPTPMVATTLPKPSPDGSLSWSTTGFVVPMVVGGSKDLYLPTRNPIVSVDCWAANVNSNKVPWDLANNLAEEIIAGIDNKTGMNHELVITKGTKTYPAVKVLDASAQGEVRRVPNDPAGYAHYSFDIRLSWVVAS